MNVGSVSNPYSNISTQSLQRSPEAAEAKKGGPDHDGDSDDQGAAAVSSAPASTVNASGQALGQVINVVA